MNSFEREDLLDEVKKTLEDLESSIKQFDESVFEEENVVIDILQTEEEKYIYNRLNECCKIMVNPSAAPEEMRRGKAGRRKSKSHENTVIRFKVGENFQMEKDDPKNDRFVLKLRMVDRKS